MSVSVMSLSFVSLVSRTILYVGSGCVWGVFVSEEGTGIRVGGWNPPDVMRSRP